MRQIHVTLAGSTQTQAKIHVVPCNRQRLIKSADVLEGIAPNHQARRRHRRIVRHRLERVVISARVGGKALEDMACETADADNDAGVLHRPVRIEQEPAYRADPVALNVAQHRFEPIDAEHFGIVVEEQQDGGLRFAHGGIIERGVIEWPSVAQDTKAGGFTARPGGEKRERRVLNAAVIDD